MGDLISHNDWELTEDSKIKNNKFVLDAFKNTFWGEKSRSETDLIILPIIGNHEGNPMNYENYDDPNGFIHTKIMPAYEPFIGLERVSNLVTKGFYTFVDESRNLKFVSLDGNLNSLFNHHASLDPTNPLNILINLSEDLYESEKNGQKVVILTHIPLADSTSQTTFVKYLRLLLQRFKDTIACSLSAHTHNDQVKFYKDKDGSNMFLEYTSPSLTTYSTINPSYREYLMAANGEIKNYSQYTMNIDVMNLYAEQKDFRFWFDLSYNFSDEYDIQTENFWSKPFYIESHTY